MCVTDRRSEAAGGEAALDHIPKPGADLGATATARAAADLASAIVALVQASLKALDHDRGPLPERVHLVRRNCKEARSLALALRQTAPDQTRKLRASLQRAGRSLRQLRDAHVAAGIARDFIEDAPPDETEGDAVVAAFTRCRASLVTAHGIAAQLEKERIPAGAAIDAIARAERKADAAYRKASHRKTESALHAWRKRLKDVRHLRRFVLGRDDETNETADHAAELLGRERDLRALARTLKDRSGREAKAARRAVRSERKALAQRALRAGRRLRDLLRSS